MISTDKQFSDPVTNDLFKEEYRALYAIDSFSSFTQSNCWFHDATKECVKDLFAENPESKTGPWYPPTPGKPEDTGTDKGDKCVDKDDHGEKNKDKTINDGDDSSNGDDGDNEGKGDNNRKD